MPTAIYPRLGMHAFVYERPVHAARAGSFANATGQAACTVCSGPIASRHEVHMSQMVADEAVSALGAETGAA